MHQDSTTQQYFYYYFPIDLNAALKENQRPRLCNVKHYTYPGLPSREGT